MSSTIAARPSKNPVFIRRQGSRHHVQATGPHEFPNARTADATSYRSLSEPNSPMHSRSTPSHRTRTDASLHMATLLLTASIAPTQVTGLTRTDPALRIADYVQALKHWLSNDRLPVDSLIFVDNTGANLDAIRSCINDYTGRKLRTQVLSVRPATIPTGIHYGYGELAMMDQAFRVSDILQNTDLIIKSTGRLYFPALRNLIHKLSSTVEMTVDCRANLTLANASRIPYATTQLFTVTPALYKTHLLDTLTWFEPRKGRTHLENRVFDAAIKASNEGHEVILRFPVNCEPQGVTGHSGANYRSASRLTRGMIRSVARRVTPDLWV